jgi:hypothetical protein
MSELSRRPAPFAGDDAGILAGRAPGNNGLR